MKYANSKKRKSRKVLCFAFTQWKNLALYSLILPALLGCSTPPFPGGAAADCAWTGIATAWIDKNLNGQFDPGEQPLPGVVFNDSEGDTATSNWNGDARLSLFMPGCGEENISVSPVVPDGYVLTTPASLTSSTSESGKVFALGFVTKPGVPTAIARPPEPSCTVYHLGKANFYDLTDVAITPNGTIWIASFDAGVFMLAPNSSN